MHCTSLTVASGSLTLGCAKCGGGDVREEVDGAVELVVMVIAGDEF